MRPALSVRSRQQRLLLPPGALVELPTPPPPPPPPTGGWPDATNTGVPTGITLTDSPGNRSYTTPGQVIDSLSITGTVRIRANNVTIKRCLIRASGYIVVLIDDYLTGVVIEDCEINGNGLSGFFNSFGLQGSGTFRRNNIHSVENGIVPGSNTTIRDNYVHDLAAPGDPHYDCVQIDGYSQDSIVIEHNTLICPPNQTAAVMIDNYFGSCSNITVNNNKLRGGSYTCYADAQFSSGGTLTNIRYTNNRIGGWLFGPFSIRQTSLTDGTGNVNDDTGAPIPPPG